MILQRNFIMKKLEITSLFEKNIGDSDVGDIIILVTDFRCLWHNDYVGDFLDFIN